MRSLLGAAAIACAAFGFVGLSVAPASAVTGTCQDDKFLIQLSDVAANNASNVFCGTGNPDYSGGAPVTETFFGMDYTLSFKSDEAKGDGKITFTDMPVDENASDLSWAISDPAGIASQVIIGFKQSGLYAAFLLSSNSGSWSITKLHKSDPNKNKIINDYSHVDIWYKPSGVTSVPLPASLPLVLAGMAGLGIFGWRRRAS